MLMDESKDPASEAKTSTSDSDARHPQEAQVHRSQRPGHAILHDEGDGCELETLNPKPLNPKPQRTL